MCFLIKKFFDDEEKILFIDRFLVSNRNFTTENVKIIKNSRLFLPKVSNSRFFQVKWQPCV